MVKHYYYNPANFQQSILGAVLNDLFRDGFQVHLQKQPQKVKFVQGKFIIENNVQNILKYSNLFCHKKYYGKNSKQQAIINMLIDVCKEIRNIEPNEQNLQKIMKKIEYLNIFWQNSQNNWIKRQFLSCHLTIFVLSFYIQEFDQDIIATNNIFTDIRTLFIESFNFREFLPIFIQNTKYQNYDLYPQIDKISNRGSLLKSSILANNPDYYIPEIQMFNQIKQDNNDIDIEQNNYNKKEQEQISQANIIIQQKQQTKRLDQNNKNNQQPQQNSTVFEIVKKQLIQQMQQKLDQHQNKNNYYVSFKKQSNQQSYQNKKEKMNFDQLQTPIKLLTQEISGQIIQSNQQSKLKFQQKNQPQGNIKQNTVLRQVNPSSNIGPANQMQKSKKKQKKVTQKPQSCTCNIY